MTQQPNRPPVHRPPVRRAAVPDSVPVALFGDEQSPQARKQYLARVAAAARALFKSGPKGIVEMPPPGAPIMRATTDVERRRKP